MPAAVATPSLAQLVSPSLAPPMLAVPLAGAGPGGAVCGLHPQPQDGGAGGAGGRVRHAHAGVGARGLLPVLPGQEASTVCVGGEGPN